MSCLYILDIKPLLVASLAGIFVHSTDCLGVFVFAALGFGPHHMACGILTEDQTCAMCSGTGVLTTGLHRSSWVVFVFLTASLAVQKFLSLTRSYLFLFSFLLP